MAEIISRGWPRGRPTLAGGAAGCGKTLMAMAFIVRGAREDRDPGDFKPFEQGSGP